MLADTDIAALLCPCHDRQAVYYIRALLLNRRIRISPSNRCHCLTTGLPQYLPDLMSTAHKGVMAMGTHGSSMH